MNAKRIIKQLKLLKLVEIDYFEKNYIIPMPNDIGTKFRTYSSMKVDLESCISMIEELINNKPTNQIIVQSLTYSAISLYAKCFTDSKLSKLEPKEIYLEGDSLLEIHTRIMSIRHNIISHRNINDDEVDIAYFVIDKKQTQYATLKYSRLKFIDLNERDVNLFRMAVLFLIGRLEEKLEKIIKKTSDAFFEKYSNKEIGKMADLNNFLADNN